ncbi:MAG TPA: hypothetical protein VGM84_26260 [Steroidobacteraceae bacterium]
MATKAGIYKGHRYRTTEHRNTQVIVEVARAGFANLLAPQVQDAALRRALTTLAASVDPRTDTAGAIFDVLAQTPKTFPIWIRRNPERVRRILDAAKESGPPQ